MTAAAVVCFLVSLVSELVGVGLVASEARAASRALRDYLALNPQGHPGGTWAQASNLEPVIVTALGNQTKRVWAIGLLVVGVLAGTLGNFLTLGD